MIDKAKITFAEALEEGRLTLVHCAVCGTDGDLREFYVSRVAGISSLRFDVANREDGFSHAVQVPTRRLSSLMQEYGIPVYCKVDVEGSEGEALSSLLDWNGDLPRFISVESECAGSGERVSEEKALETLRTLKALGYDRFKLIEQRNLVELKLHEPFFSERSMRDKVARVLRRCGLAPSRSVEKADRDGRVFQFPYGSSGLFGDDLSGEWLSYSDAEDTLLFHRRAYFKLRSSVNCGFWCDWHGKKGRVRAR